MSERELPMLVRAAARVLPRLTRWFPGLVRVVARRAPVPAAVQLLQRLTAYWTSQAISLAAQLGLVDLLRGSDRDAADLARELALPLDPLQRLLRALASDGILRELEDGRFRATELGELLRSDRPDSLRAAALACGGEWYRSWGELGHSLATGESAFQKIYGERYFDYLARRPITRRTFDEAMRGISSMTDLPVAMAYDFSKLRQLTDVGGGTGSQLAAILSLNTRLHGIVFDRPAVVADARAALQAPASVKQRLHFCEGDFTQGVPAGSDAYLMKTILHDWDDEDALRILRRCREQMAAGSRLLIVEHVLLPGSAPQFGKALDLMMLVVLGARERTLLEYRTLLEKANLRLTGEFPTLAELTVLEAVPC